MVVTSGITPLEVDLVAGIVQEVVVEIRKDICPLVEEIVENIWVVPHGFKLPFSKLFIGLVVNEDQIAFAKGARVDMGFIPSL